MHAIFIRDVSKHYKLGHLAPDQSLHVLDHVSLAIPRGEFVGIIGPNGCGKSTLFKMILGMENPDSGEVTVNGKKPEEVRIGYVPQHGSGALYPWFTSKENLHFATIDNSPETTQLVLAKLNEFGVAPYVDAYPYQLSGGLKQLVSIARATLSSDIFLLDEPLTGLDFQNRLAVEKKLLGMRDGKNTIVLVSHDIESAILLCDRLVILSSKPTRIKAVLSISLPKHRTHETRFLPAFQTVLNQVYSVISE